MPFPYSLFDPPPVPQPDPFLLPTEFTAGDTFLFQVNDNSVYPSTAGWTYTLSLRGGGTSIDISATFSGGIFSMAQTSAQTVNWQAGRYSFDLFAVNANPAQRNVVASGFIKILVNLSTQGGAADLRSHARRVLDLIEATLELRATDDILDTSVEGTTFRRLTPEQLEKMRWRYKREVQMEEAKARAKNGLATGRNIYARFTQPA